MNLSVYNVLGQTVATLANQNFEAGAHVVMFDASTLPSGIYFARLSALGETRMHRLLLAK